MSARSRANPWFRGKTVGEPTRPPVLDPVPPHPDRFFFIGCEAGRMAFGMTPDQCYEHNKAEWERYKKRTVIAE